MRHKLGWLWATQNTTMEDLEVMVYLLLSLWIVVLARCSFHVDQ